MIDRSKAFDLMCEYTTQESLRRRGFVRRQVISDHHIARLKTGCELSFDVDLKSGTVHRPIQHPGSGQFIHAEPGDESLRTPVAKGRIRFQPHPAQRPSPQAGHLGGDGGLIDKDQPVWLKTHPWLTAMLPFETFGAHLYPSAFCRNQGFFYMYNQAGGSDDATTLPVLP